MSMSLSTLVTEPLQTGFFVRGLFAAVLVTVAGAMLGFGVLTRRHAYLGQGVSQSMVAGVALGSFAGISPTVAAFLAALVAAALISRLGGVAGLGADAAVAVVASASMSIGVAVISSDRSRALNLNNLLFGNVLGVTWNELVLLAVAVVAASIFTLTQARRLALAAICAPVASAHGIAVRRLELQRLVTLSLITAAAVQIVGVTLVVAALVVPAAAAALFTRTLGGAHLLAALFSVIVAVFGLYLSYWYDLASGPSVVLTATALYTVALFSSALRRVR
jgi:ABC-type Mn2+/Zn2+ transport system permease subunit